MRIFLLLFIWFAFITSAQAQLIEKNASSNIVQHLKKLKETASVLYIAAHPDDENTRLISYLANEEMVRTGYLSLTRGDGGQNLIGTEKGPSLGLLRTQELLAARRIDGGEQFFTRAIDFGYSKTAVETFDFWNKEEILHDVVLVIRQFRPDIIVTRFPPNEYAGHGHHTASAMLAEEAFKAAADPKRFPEQITNRGLKAWQVKRLYFNASSWWNKDLPKIADTSDNYVKVDIGMYNHILGLGYGEIAAESRSQHKSQGFGAARQRGERFEYLEYKLGDKVTNKDLFQGITRSWNDYDKQGKIIASLIEDISNSYEASTPSLVLPKLMTLRDLLESMEQNALIERKLEEVNTLALMICGIHQEITSDQPIGTVGEDFSFTFKTVQRSNAKVSIKSIAIFGQENKPNKTLENNILEEFSIKTKIPGSIKSSNPYWLNHEQAFIFKLDDPEMIGKAESPALMGQVKLEIEGRLFSLNLPIQYRWVDREKGELYRPFVILPKVTLGITNPVLIFSDQQSKSIEVKMELHQPNLSGVVKLNLPDGWKSVPETYDFNGEKDESTQLFKFNVTPPSSAQVGEVSCEATVNDETFKKQLTTIAYDHIPTQIMLTKASAKLINLDIKREGKRIAYVMGAGDEVPDNLMQIGYQVELIDADNLISTELKGYDALIFGIRAYNTKPILASAKQHILDYAKAGGTVILQYNTSRRINTDDFSPYPLKLSRDRVTDEKSDVEFALPKHPTLNQPNTLSDVDFQNWVQERGLYFPNEWDSNFKAPLGWNDKGESIKYGGLLVSDYGEGAFIYTGISFFRQLPAGVPGAFKLIANLISYKPESDNGNN